MNSVRPHVLSIAGFDPSGGAGILADIKTFEACKTIGFGVCTAITFQNDVEFDGLNWIGLEDIKKQIAVVYRKFSIDWVKIGLIQNLDVLNEIVLLLKNLNPKVTIVWDPIIKASAGFTFHSEIHQPKLAAVLENIFLVTPNLEEIAKLSAVDDKNLAAKKLSGSCHVLLKGGHSSDEKALDQLYEKNEITSFDGEMLEGNKHGTGCVLSAVILSQLSKGKNLKEACRAGKIYIKEFILSNKGMLGYHYHYE